MYLSNRLKGIGIFLFGLLSIAVANAQLDSQSVTNDEKIPSVKYVPLISQPLRFPQMTTNFSNTNAHDTYEGWLLGVVADTERKLQQTNLNTNYRQSLEWLLRLNQGNLSNYQAQIQRDSDFIKSVKSNPQTAWTNLPDPIEVALASDVTKYEGELANTSLAPNMRKIYEAMLENYKQKLADHETNAQLWANLRLAQMSQSAETVSDAEHKLSDYLAVKIGKPTGMSLEAVMEKYKKRSGDYHWFDNRTIVRAVMLTAFLLPPFIMLYIAIRKRISK